MTSHATEKNVFLKENDYSITFLNKDNLIAIKIVNYYDTCEKIDRV